MSHAQCDGDHGHAHGPRAARVNDGKDPIPRVKTKRDRYRRALTRRVDEFRAALRTTIITNDAAHLGQEYRTNAEPTETFGFGERADKQVAFDDWVERNLDNGVLEVSSRDAVRGGRHFTGRHVREGYEGGIKWADRQMREAGAPVGGEGQPPLDVDLNTGVHESELQTLYLRNYRGLEKITDEMGADISRTFAEALKEGVNPREAGRRLTDDVNTYRNRAETLARTEFQNALSTGTANRYQSYGVQEVRILTADPCPKCADLAGSGPYPIEEASGLLPNRTHPNCICSLAPVTNYA